MIDRRLMKAILKSYRLPLDGKHGLAHWGRVLENGRLLAERNGADLQVVELFAVFHDSRRRNEHGDDGHGERGANLAARLWRSHFQLAEERFDLLYLACLEHTDGHTEGNLTVRTCWDADRLDLARVGVQPVPELLCTEEARDPQVIAWASRRSRAGFVPGVVEAEWLAE